MGKDLKTLLPGLIIDAGLSPVIPTSVFHINKFLVGLSEMEYIQPFFKTTYKLTTYQK